jgi:transcriptional regulator GlxA family with amidase domain
VLRFDRAKALLGASPLSLAEIALDCGYYDQAHMSRDFRAFAGCHADRADGEAAAGRLERRRGHIRPRRRARRRVASPP